MEKVINKILYKVLPFVLCISIVSGAAAPAYASPTTPDLEAQYLWDLYWTTSSNPSGKNGSWYGVVRTLLKDIFDKLELVQSDQRNLWTYNSTSYRLKNFTDTTSLSESYYINSGAYPMSWLLNSMANLSQNTGYTANQFYNSNSNLNKAMSAMVSLNQNFQDYTTVLNNIKSNTDNLSGIKTNTNNLSGIKTNTDNLSGIKTDTANLSDIKTDTANLSGIKTDTANLSDIKTDTDSIDSKLTSYLYNTNFTGNFITGWNTSNGLRDIKNNNSLAVTNNSNNTYRLNVRNGSNSSILYNTGVNPNNLYRHLSYQSLILGQLSEFIFTPNTYYHAYFGDNNGNTIERNPASIGEYLYLISYQLSQSLNPLQYVLADSDTIAAKSANKNQEQTVLTNFTGSGAASASVSDFGAVKDSMVDLKAGFSGGASSSDTFSFLSGDSNAWDWFTQDTANDLDRTQGSNTRLLRGSSNVAYDTPLLDSYYTSILSILGGDE